MPRRERFACRMSSTNKTKMKHFPLIQTFAALGLAALVSGCSSATKVLKNPDYSYKLESAKQYYMAGSYSNASMLLDNVIPAFRNTKSGDEALYMMGMCKFLTRDYASASEIFKRYYSRSYPAGNFVDEARFYAAKSYYLSTLPTKLDQTGTYTAINELNSVLEYNPTNKHAAEIKDLIFKLQDKLVEKEFLAAKLYYDLGGYFGNCSNGGNNYQACIVTAQNAVRAYPYSARKESFAILILKAKYKLAEQSVEEKKYERLNDTVDEYHGFVNEFPKSSHLQEARDIYAKTEKELKTKKLAKYNTGGQE